MSIELGRAYCALCLKRPVAEGGNGTCPILEPLRSSRQSDPHVAHDCSAFQVGDARPRRAKELPDSLFDLVGEEPAVNGAYGEGR